MISMRIPVLLRNTTIGINRTKFQIARRSTFWEIFLCITLEWEMENKEMGGKKKEGKINFSIMIFLYTIYVNPL